MKVKKAKWLVILMVVAIMLSLVPATAFAESIVDECGLLEVRLLAGQDEEVGSVTVTNDGEKICVTYALDQDALDAGWLIYETHLAIATEFEGIPQTRGNRWGTNPIPGQFPYGDDELEGVPEWTFCISLDELGVEYGDDVYIAAHAALSNGESAWGEGYRFNERGNWGMWFNYTVCEPADDLFELTFNIIGNGQAFGAGTYAAGEVVAIEAIPNPGNIFQFWSAPAGTIANEFAASTTFTMPDQDVTITARFMPEGQYEERERDHTHFCVDQTGGVGIIVDTWDISAVAEGTVLDFYFHGLSQPDRWTIWYGGEVVFSSGWVSTNPDHWSAQPLFAAEGVQHHYWHPDVEASTWRTWSGPYPEGGLYQAIVTKEAGKDEVVIRTEGGEPGTVWYYKLCES